MTHDTSGSDLGISRPSRRPRLEQERCERLEYQAGIGEEDEYICKLCQECVGNYESVPWENSVNGSGLTWLRHGSIEEILGRHQCPLCNILGQLIPKDSPLHAQIIIRMSYGWPDLSQQKPTVEVWMERPDVPDDPDDDYSDMRLAKEYGSIYFEPMALSRSPSLEISLPSFRDEESKKTSIVRLCPQTMKDWIMDCETKHNHPTTGNFTRDQLPIDIILIDTEENRLVEATSKSRFLALSYVWGKQRMFMTTSSNRHDMEKPGALRLPGFPIPPVVRDAMELVLMLGERYLWVDVLCIEQDNPLHKHSQITQMDIIYSKAVATIVALSAVDAQSSLPGVRPGTRLSSEIIATVGRYRVRTSRPSFQCCLDNSEYETRAWTYQERILSRRCIFFTNHETWFHCPSAQCNDVDPSLRMLAEDRANKFNKLYIPRSNRFSSWSSVIKCYSLIISEYTRRCLSYPSDSLNAISGILSRLEHMVGGGTIEGLLKSHLDLCLIWIPATYKQQNRNSHFASWSWAGWTGHSQYQNGPIYPWITEPFTTALPIRSEIEKFEYSYRIPKQRQQRIMEGNQSKDSLGSQPVEKPRSNTKAILYFETATIDRGAFCVASFPDVIMDSPPTLV